MLDDNVDAFVRAARLGSFARAAAELYLTPNAVKKRVQALERRTGLRLFIRSNRGLALTPAGSVLLDDLSTMERQLERSLAAARAVQERGEGALWLGVTGVFAEELLSSRWPGADRLARQSQTRVVHYGTSAADRDEMMRDVGARIDACVDLLEPGLAEAFGLRATETSRFRLCLGSAGAPAAGALRVSDVEKDTVALLPRGRSAPFDAVRARLARERPDVALVDVSDYGLRSLDELRARDCAVVAPQNVAGLYPHLSFSPIEGAPLVSFAVYAPPDAPGAVRDLVEGLCAARNF